MKIGIQIKKDHPKLLVRGESISRWDDRVSYERLSFDDAIKRGLHRQLFQTAYGLKDWMMEEIVRGDMLKVRYEDDSMFVEFDPPGAVTAEEAGAAFEALRLMNLPDR